MPDPSPTDLARRLLAIISKALSGAALEDYGIAASREQGDQILRELLSLSLFWTWSALDVGFSDKDRDRLWAALMGDLRTAWSGEFGLPPGDFDGYLDEFSNRRRLYESLTREGGTPATLAAEAAGIMEAESAIDPDDHPKMLALLVDLVPADELGTAVEEVEGAD
jgi:hypothetical protein